MNRIETLLSSGTLRDPFVRCVGVNCTSKPDSLVIPHRSYFLLGLTDLPVPYDPVAGSTLGYYMGYQTRSRLKSGEQTPRNQGSLEIMEEN